VVANVLFPHGSNPDCARMNREEYDRMYFLEGTYWWFQGRLRIIKRVLEAYLPIKPRRGRVLDVGCGTGLMLDEFKSWSPVGLDFSGAALKYCRQRGLNQILRGDVTNLPIDSNSIDLILALDLMEHVDRHDLMIREFHRVLKPGGCLMATVPAHPNLWSDHDIALHHFRRYTRGSLRALLKHGGLKPLKFSYAITFTYPAIVLFRRIQQWYQGLRGGKRREGAKAHLIALPRPLNALLTHILHLEAALLARMNLPFGVTLVTLARKPLSRSDR